MAKRSKYRPIEDYGLIGDMHTCALVNMEGSLDFCCWPTFDSPSLFCRLLDAENGGHFSIRPSSTMEPSYPGLKQKYITPTNVLQTGFIHERGVVTLYDFFVVEDWVKASTGKPQEAHMLSRSPRLMRRAECVRGEMALDVEFCPRPNYSRDRCHIRRRKNPRDDTSLQYEITNPEYSLHLDISASSSEKRGARSTSQFRRYTGRA